MISLLSRGILSDMESKVMAKLLESQSLLSRGILSDQEESHKEVEFKCRNPF